MVSAKWEISTILLYWRAAHRAEFPFLFRDEINSGAAINYGSGKNETQFERIRASRQILPSFNLRYFAGRRQKRHVFMAHWRALPFTLLEQNTLALPLNENI